MVVDARTWDTPYAPLVCLVIAEKFIYVGEAYFMTFGIV